MLTISNKTECPSRSCYFLVPQAMEFMFRSARTVCCCGSSFVKAVTSQAQNNTVSTLSTMKGALKTDTRMVAFAQASSCLPSALAGSCQGKMTVDLPFQVKVDLYDEEDVTRPQAVFLCDNVYDCWICKDWSSSSSTKAQYALHPRGWSLGKPQTTLRSKASSPPPKMEDESSNTLTRGEKSIFKYEEGESVLQEAVTL